jgi:hypothetical protein
MLKIEFGARKAYRLDVMVYGLPKFTSTEKPLLLESFAAAPLRLPLGLTHDQLCILDSWGGLFDCGALPNLWPSWGVWFPPSGPVFASIFVGVFLGV